MVPFQSRGRRSMTLPTVGKDLAETRLKRQLRPCRIEMGNVTESEHTERGSALEPFFRCDHRHGAGSRAGTVPPDHGADFQKMGKKQALQAEMAEKHQRVLVSVFHLVQKIVVHIAMFPEELVKSVFDLFCDPA